MSADPIANAPPPESQRLAAWLVALVTGLPAVIALVIGFADPASGFTSFLVAGMFIMVGIAAGLALRIVALTRRGRAEAARLERLQDSSWEWNEKKGARAVEAAIPIATVSHEMRAPLNGMLALADLLAETALTAEQRGYLTALSQSAAALARLVDDLLDASRIATGQFLLDPTPTDIETLVEDVAALLAPIAHERGIGLGTRVAPGLPQVLVDAGRLRQVMVNLVTNAIAATERGAVLIAVDLADHVEVAGIALGFAVHDSGGGVDGADRDRIFASFERARTDGRGLGLGLAISQQIVGRMGGHIEHEARPGGGAVFHFTLAFRAVGAMARLAAPLHGLPLLLAAPHGLETDALAATLDAAGAETRSAATLGEAVGLVGAAAAAGQPYRMILADARLATDLGAALRRLRASAGHALPVAVLVDSRERPAPETLEADGFAAYLIRPVRRHSLLSVVSEGSTAPGRFLADPADMPDERAASRPAAGPLDVLVVEDDPVSALLARAVIERLGHEVDERESLAAVRARGGATPDVALVDLNLADGDGLALIRDFASLGASRPAIIATSGDGAPAVRHAALAAGADRFLEKPVSAEGLRRAFDEALTRRSIDREPRHQTA